MRVARTLKQVGLVAPVWHETEPGLSFLADPADVVDISLLNGATWDSSVWDMLAGNVKPGGTLVDVGAHIGTFTLRGAKVVGSQGRVVAIEPNPITFARLQENVSHNNLRHVSLVQAACGDKPGQMKLYAGSAINSGLASLARQNVVDQASDGQVYFNVQVIPLDQIVADAKLDRVDVIKVDTEGAETMIIRSGKETLNRFRPVLVMETIDHHLRNLGSSLAELDALMAEMGYEIRHRTKSDTCYVPKKQQAVVAKGE